MQRRFWVLSFTVALVAVLLAGCGKLGKLHHGAKVEAAAVPLRVVALPSSVYNLADPNPAYLRLGVSLALATPAGKDDSTVKSVARDTLVNLVTVKTSAELLTAAGKSALKQAALAEMQKRLPAAGIKDIYFDEFLIQR